MPKIIALSDAICDWAGCLETPTHEVVADGNGFAFGKFCVKHASAWVQRWEAQHPLKPVPPVDLDTGRKN